MKFRLSLDVFLPILYLFLSITAQGIDEGGNVLKNPGFEDGLKSWKAHKSQITPQIDNSTVQGVGSSSLKIVGKAKKVGYITQTIKIRPQRNKYKLSGWIKTKDFADKWAASIWLQCAVQKGGKRFWKAFALQTNYHLPNLEWSKFEKTIDIPPNTEYMNILLRTRPVSKNVQNNSGTAWFDNISLEQIKTDEQIKAEAPPENINYIPTNENILKNTSFKNNFEHWFIKKSQGFVTPVCDSENAIKLFEQESRTRLFMRQFFVGLTKGERYRLSLEIKTDILENPDLNIEVIPKKEKASLVDLKTKGKVSPGTWEKISCEFDVPKNYWRSLFSLVIRANRLKGNIWIKSLSLERILPVKNESVKVYRFYPLGKLGIFSKEQQPEVMLQLANGWKKSKNMICEITVEDFYHKRVHQSKHDISLNAQRLNSKKIHIPAINQQGFYIVKAVVKNGNKIESASSTTLCIFDHFKKRYPFFAINGSYPCPYDVASLFGVGGVEIRMYWGEINPRNGVYNWEKIDEKVKAAIHNKMQIVGTFLPAHHKGGRYVPSWLFKLTESRIKENLPPFDGPYTEAWQEFVKTAVSRYRDKIKIWSIREELDAGKQSKIRTDNYLKKVKLASPIIRKLCPDSIVGGICMAGHDGQQSPRFPLARRYWEELHDYLDGMFSDPYLAARVYGPGMKSMSPEAGQEREVLLAMVNLIKKYGKNKIGIAEKGTIIRAEQVASSEYGWDRAKALARSFIIAKSVPELMFYSWFYALGPMLGVQQGRDYGLWQNLFDFKIVAPRPSLAAYCTTARFLGGTKSPQKLDLHHDLQGYVFKKKDSNVVVLWTINKESVKFTFKSLTTLRLYNLMGNLVEVLQPGLHTLSLSDEPIFLTVQGEQEKCINIFSKAKYSLPLAKAEIHLIDKNTIGVTIVSQTPKDTSAKIVMGGNGSNALLDKQKITKLSGKSTITSLFKLKPDSYLSLNDKTFIANIKFGEYVFEVKKRIEFFIVPKLSERVKVDGMLSEYKNIIPIVRDNAENLYPTDAIVFKQWTGPNDLSSKVYIAYDDNYLYFAATVTDDYFVNITSGNRLFLGDSFQIAIDTLNDALCPDLLGGAQGYDENDYEYGIALTEKGPEVFCWTAAKERKKIAGSIRKIPFKVKKVNKNTWNYELAIPWTDLVPLRPLEGSVFALEYVLIDNDTPGTKKIKCGQMLSGGIVGGKNPSLFKTFILGK